MTSHSIEDSKYTGGFKEVLDAYRDNDEEFISMCESKASRVAPHTR